MWREAPWFGVGGWGFRHEYVRHVPRDYKYYLATPGKANVHNDTLQFLAEFGAVGAGAMALAVAAMGFPFLRRRAVHAPVVVLSGLGLAAVVAHSCVDIPFRCPAILYTWIAVLAAAGGMAAHLRSRKPWAPFAQPKGKP